MFTVGVEESFRAAHSLKNSDGTREKPHSHNWRVQAVVGGEPDEAAVVLDFRELSGRLEKVLDGLGNRSLDDMDYFRKNGSSAEMVARYIYLELQRDLPLSFRLERVTVFEDCGRWAGFRRD